MPSNTKPFSALYTNTYYGDILSELVRLYNSHDHAITSLKSFAVLNLQKSQQISFTPTDNLPDPFNQLNNTNPLTIEKITASTLTVNRNALANVEGFLTYTNGNEYQQINNVTTQAGSADIIWQDNPTDAGSITPNTLSALLEKTYTNYYKFLDNSDESLNLYTAPTSAESSKTRLFVSLNLLDQFEIVDEENKSVLVNNILTLNRGSVYEFYLSESLIVDGGFYLVEDLVNPAYPIKPINSGVSPIKDLTQVLIGFKFYVPAATPSTIYYQSKTAANRYGQINIVGGELTEDNAVYALWQDKLDLTVPSQVPDYLIPLTISTSKPSRLIDWYLYPEWTGSLDIGRLFIQLQLHNASTGITALSDLTLIDSLGKHLIDIDQNYIIPQNSCMMCAVYTPYKVKGLWQELLTTGLIS